VVGVDVAHRRRGRRGVEKVAVTVKTNNSGKLERNWTAPCVRWEGGKRVISYLGDQKNKRAKKDSWDEGQNLFIGHGNEQALFKVFGVGKGKNSFLSEDNRRKKAKRRASDYWAVREGSLFRGLREKRGGRVGE